MKRNSILVTTVAVILWMALTVVAAEDWGSDFEAAKRAAVEGKRLILADFTGSDWCPWCVKLNGEVFQSEVFRNFAKENLVLFLADFPNEKQIPKEVAEQNRKLAADYGVQGFPTILLLAADGKELARTGYRRGGAEAYVEHLKALMKRPKTK
jgi:protein disulfide-isomerase